ncbi:MAG TPA: histidine kinase [Kofleriaceae bacterium]|nr:histidine kinase [Kofleriaceae bacterium]
MRIARTMQLVGYALYIIAGVLRVIDFGTAAPPAWLIAYAVLGVSLHLGASAPDDAAHRWRRIAALAVMTPAMIAMAAIRPCAYGAFTLVVVASQAALVLRPAAAAVWVVAQTAVVSYCLIPALGGLLGMAEVIALFGFQGFAIAAIAAARREARARGALARSHAELLATRALLDEATRANERTRIARDLHDVLGHNLTALGLQLEIASHLEQSAAQAHTAKARELTVRLLDDVRAVVAAMRPAHPPALVAAIRAIVVDAPGLAIHVDAPDSLVVEDPRRAECIVRCVQEIVTNARRHARGAANLWIQLRCEAGAIVVDAHDDGVGAADIRAGHGLGGMRSRLEEMGGRLEVHAAPARAFAVHAHLPLGAAP